MSTERESTAYVGRFAPSPTGPLHFGSLVAATASYLQAKANNGQWLLRIEDIDPPREQPGATALILDTLKHYGFDWDGEVIYQRLNDSAHRAALRRLLDGEFAYRCRCSRRDLAAAPRGALGTIYPGTCRSGSEGKDFAIRVRTDKREIDFVDLLQGRFSQCLERDSGDFIVERRDKLIAYHLAVVVDDHLQGITEVVRGIDLLDTTPRHIWLQQLLGYTTPNYMHLPIIAHPNGDKFSKLTGAPGISTSNIEGTLVDALDSLRQEPPAELREKNLEEIWTWAQENWKPGQLFGVRSITKLA